MQPSFKTGNHQCSTGCVIVLLANKNTTEIQRTLSNHDHNHNEYLV